jgi:hypothetical protein
MKSNDINSIEVFQNGLLFGSNAPIFQYLTKEKDDFELIEYLCYLKNDKIFHISIYNNFLFAIGNNNILIFEIKNI